MAKSKPRSVSESELRKMFARGQFAEKASRGEYREVVDWENHPSPPRSFLPFCTKSQMVKYQDVIGDTVAIVHQYLKPDGTLGASGKPDPKFLIHNGQRYHLTPPNGK